MANSTEVEDHRVAGLAGHWHEDAHCLKCSNARAGRKVALLERCSPGLVPDMTPPPPKRLQRSARFLRDPQVTFPLVDNAEPHVFDRSLDLTKVAGGEYRGVLDRTWWIDFGPNGGFLAALLLKAVLLEVDDPARHPRTLSVHYPGRAREGEVAFEVTVERSGRSATFVTARMRQEGTLLSTAQCVLSLDRPSGSFDDSGFPGAVAPGEIPELSLPPSATPRFAQNLDYRFVLGAFPYSGVDQALLGAWVRLKEPRVPDSLTMAMFSDGMPPASFTRASKPFPIPTLDLTVHFRTPLPLDSATPADWCLARFESRFARHGFIEEDGYIWSEDGVLLAHSRQLAIYGTEMGTPSFD